MIRRRRTSVRSIGGIDVRIVADRRALEVVDSRFGQAPGHGPGELQLDLTVTDVGLPASAPHDRAVDADVWFDDGQVWWHWLGVEATATSGCAAIRRPRRPDRDTDAATDLLAQYAIAAAAATPDRVLLHAAALGRGDEALVVIGPSGAGKSTLSGAALLAGWQLLADDLLVVRRTAAGLDVEGIGRRPLLPREILGGDGAATLRAEAADTERDRLAAPLEVLTCGRHRVRAVVVVGHDPARGAWSEVGGGERAGALVHGLAVPPVPPVTRAHLPMLAALGERPVVQLGHARDPDVRAARAVELLEQVWAATT